MPYTGPGRYDAFKYEKGKRTQYAGLAKATGRKFDPKEFAYAK